MIAEILKLNIIAKNKQMNDCQNGNINADNKKINDC